MLLLVGVPKTSVMQPIRPRVASRPQTMQHGAGQRLMKSLGDAR